MDWLHRWYNHAAHLVSSSTALAVLNNTSEKRNSTSHNAMQVRNWWKTVGTEGKLYTINWNKKGWMKCYIYGNVRIAQSSILQFVIMLGKLKKGLGMESKCLCSKNTAVCQNGLYQKCMMWVSYKFIAS